MTEIWTTFAEGGHVIIPALMIADFVLLFVTSIVACAVIFERAFFLRRKRIINPDLIQLILNFKNSKTLKNSMVTLKHQQGSFMNIVRAALEHQQDSSEEIKEAIIDQGRRETRQLEKGLIVLETAATVGPLLGLLGTVLGMVKEFIEGIGQTQEFSGGIAEALITTVIGLSIAIPSLIAYNYFNHKVEDLVLEVEQYSSKLLKKLKKKNGNRGVI